MSQLNDYLKQNDPSEVEWERNQERSLKADTVAYYEDFNNEVYGIKMNLKLWICQDCKKFQVHPAPKYRSLLDNNEYFTGSFVCEKCKTRNGYDSDEGSVAYFHDVWELTTHKENDNIAILPKMFHQLSTYPLYKDLSGLVFMRKMRTNSTLANETPEVRELTHILHTLRVFRMTDLNLEESLNIFWHHHDMPRSQHFIPAEIYGKDRMNWQNRVSGLYEKLIFPSVQ